MKKSEVHVGGHYVAKVSGKLTIVKLVQERQVRQFGYCSAGTQVRTQWQAINVTTGREVTIRSAARLRYAVEPVDGGKFRRQSA